MKILWVKAGKLVPVDTGGRIRSYNILRNLACHHELVLLSYYDGPCDAAYEAEIARRLPGSVVMNTAGPRTRLGEALRYVRHIPSRAPYAVTKFTAAMVRRLLDQWIRERRFDVAVCDFLSASLNFPQALETPTVLFQHNLETALWRRQAAWEANPINRWAFRIEVAKMARYEQATVRRFHHVIAVSEHDRDEMKAMVDPARITVVPTGVDIEEYRGAAKPDVLEPLVVFTGSMDWEANIDAVDYFCRDIWPHVLAKAPNARFRIVGRNPHPRVQKLASPTIEVTGAVPSVIDHLNQAAVVIVPLRIGGGTRLKIYEAMAMARPVVSTTVGAEGLDVHHGTDILLADDPAAFAECIVMLLENPDLREKYGRAAAELASRYDWSRIAERFAAVLERVIRLGAGTPSGASPLHSGGRAGG